MHSACSNLDLLTPKCFVRRRTCRVFLAMHIHPPLTSRHKTKRVEWARNYMKVDFQTVLFTDECRATLDGPDGWSRGWLVNGMTRPSRGRRQQGGGSVMFWAALIGRDVVGPFRVPDGLKMNAQSYTKFLQDNFIPWYRKRIFQKEDNFHAGQRAITCRTLYDCLPGKAWF